MSEIADLCSRALHDLPIGVEKQIDLGRQRGDVLRKLTADPLGFTPADRRNALLQDAKRPQPETHRQGCGTQKRQRQDEKGGGERVFEILDLCLYDIGVGRDLDEIAALLARVDFALNHAERLVSRADDIAAPRALVRKGLALIDARQLGGEERPRRTHVRVIAVEPGDLPIPAGKGEFELGRDHRRNRGFGLLGNRNIGDKRLEVDARLVVEIRFAPSGVQGREA